MPVPSRFGIYARTTGGAPGSSTTLNPADKGAQITLSGGNLTATKNTVDSFQSVRATVSKSTGKYYFECTTVGGGSGGQTIVGWANGAASLATFFGATSDSIAYQGSSGALFMNGVTIASYDTWGNPGEISRIAVDWGAKKIWVGRVGTGLWNGSGAADPATGAGGVNIAAINAGPYFPGVSVYSAASPSSLTVNFGATPFAGFLPSGFSVVS